MIKDALRQALRRLGYVVQRVGGPMDRCTMDGAFRALVRREHAFKTVIDVGAASLGVQIGRPAPQLARVIEQNQHGAISDLRADPFWQQAQETLRGRVPSV